MAQPVFAREDTLFGVCFALGADFGFNPVWLRVAFALLLFWSPVIAAGAYAAFGALVVVSRLLVPEPADAPAQPADEPAAEPDPVDLKLAA